MAGVSLAAEMRAGDVWAQAVACTNASSSAVVAMCREPPVRHVVADLMRTSWMTTETRVAARGTQCVHAASCRAAPSLAGRRAVDSGHGNA
ncbi:hypothetical protein CMZ84_05345 [Lysobacteraceae bacterium NML93-0399]|nr:hypothetical protein CMZ84_05345 [Xanthomonadaceae bacterium NML93-0399]